jgi:hypothetical protein
MLNDDFNVTMKGVGMKRLSICCVLALMVLMGCGPSPEEKKAAAEKVMISDFQEKVSAGFKDPASTQFRSVKLVGNGDGFCGELNTKNGFGAYDGFKPFGIEKGAGLVLLNAIPIVEIVAMSNMEHKQRDEYLRKHAGGFLMVGDRAKAVQILSDGLEYSKFKYWKECFPK